MTVQTEFLPGLLTVDYATRKDLKPLIPLNFDAGVRFEEEQDRIANILPESFTD